ncbi:MAG TPA: ATP-binding protein [Thermoanaerobaculia bacterium]|nr:ATP-binding protein [Thermoanaerobaculia bacterium]
MFVPRTLSGLLEKAVKGFPATLVTGPRQSGKTTLLRSHFGATHRYVSLEAPHIRERALADPVGFLGDHPPPVILDEIQHAPALLSYLQVAIDEDRRPGRWLLSGSQSFPLLQGTSESLAGRVAILTLLPLSWNEIQHRARSQDPVEKVLDELLEARPAIAAPSPPDLAHWLLCGGFPQLWSDPGVDRQLWLASYVQTYLERDVRSVLGVRDLGAFQTFLRLAAARTAQVLNLVDLARDVGVSPPTIRQWLSVLEASHQVFLLRPHFENLGKRLVKTPKLYWLDTGLVCFLLGLKDEDAVLQGPMAGPLFETAVVAELAKLFYHRGLPPALWYWRSRDGWEVDVLIELQGKLHPVEVKATATPRPTHVENVARWRSLAGDRAGSGLLVSRAEGASALVPGVRVLPWHLL